MVKDINTVVTGSSNAGYYVNATTPLGNKVLFNASEKAHGSELYTSDGTAAGTFLLNDILPGEMVSAKQVLSQYLITKNNFVYFIAQAIMIYDSFYALIVFSKQMVQKELACKSCARLLIHI